MYDSSNIVHRITGVIRRDYSHQATELLEELGLQSVLLENGRSVRRRRYARPFGLPGYSERLENSPLDLYQFSVKAENSEIIMRCLASALQLDLPGHGAIYAQKCQAFVDVPDDINIAKLDEQQRLPWLLRDLAMITCVMSMHNSGEELAKLALELGTGVPMVTLGSGSGLRNRLGLLRITVPAEKELVRLLVPALDAEGLMRLLIEKGHLNRPGKGFIYCIPVVSGLLDTSLLVGPQQHAATMEQVVAAIDEMKKNTAWRRRFPALDPDAGFQLQPKCDEITMICQEEAAAKYVNAAMQAGARAATNADLHRVSFGKTASGACERCTLVVRQTLTEKVLNALLEAQKNTTMQLESLEVQPVKLSFTYRS